MHIAFIIPDLKGGGAQKMMINLANEFSTRGHQVDLVLVNQSGIYKDDINPSVRIIDFKKPRVFQSIPALVHYIQDEVPDVMISALFHMNLAAIIARIWARSPKVRLVISERNHLSRRLSEMSGINQKFLRFMVKLFYPKADKIIGISNGVCDDLKNLIQVQDTEKIQTIYNPVVTDQFESLLSENVFAVFPENSGLKLITSGRLVAQKDYPTLFQAVALYKQKYGPVHLAILGEGILKSELEALAQRLDLVENISFLGFVDNSLAYMKQADMFVMSSAWEGFCNVIVEALYCGLKIVSTNCPSGPAEILDNGKYGTLVPVGDSEALKEAIYAVKDQNVQPDHQKQRALGFTVQHKADEFQKVFLS